ncbi:MAG: D-glycero-beta-D-manno-heptose 1-phosphate adenylyltransferase [Bacteroidales bacterium]|nr:D-glycero-beta-D-manno-heptose 1-phosphate adenylyltransferase [Bacteroidales bacterium]MCF8334262.1 D-glycero-beta-D-manno-heptose 1-phosphate adenylyltransferase [Bacteroidales bacterium]
MNNLNIIQSKILDWEQLNPNLARWRFKNYKIVFTNGCFDILHRGHIEYMAKAADLGDILILGLNSDASVQMLKEKTRPVINQESRAMTLASLKFIDAVVLFDEETPYELIKHIQPDILVKGKDYQPQDIAGADIIQAKGGQIETIELVDGYSTSKIIEKIRNA